MKYLTITITVVTVADSPINQIRKCDLLRQVFLFRRKQEMSGLHGVETIELTSGTVAVETISTAVI
ncbi:hypothetical protein AA469_005000, partial [Salmonella enterica subsp. enterica]|nr:hypothetical protein [Salmonella enterica subsp. enterica]